MSGRRHSGKLIEKHKRNVLLDCVCLPFSFVLQHIHIPNSQKPDSKNTENTNKIRRLLHVTENRPSSKTSVFEVTVKQTNVNNNNSNNPPTLPFGVWEQHQS